MVAHRVMKLVRAVTDFDSTRAFYREFGLDEVRAGVFASVVGGEQLEVVASDQASILRLEIAVDSPEDLEVIARRLSAMGVESASVAGALEACEPASGIAVRLCVAKRLPDDEAYEPGELRRDLLVPRDPVKPRRLGHVVIGCVDVEASKTFFLDGLGMRLSDYVNGGPFMRFERDHHNIVMVPAPFTLLHHTAWKVRSVDEIGYGGSQMIENHPNRHAWGLGRHAASANYFWYLRDPAGAFAEYYYSDLDEQAPDEFFWDQVHGIEPLPVAAWASPSLTDNPLAPNAPEEMPAPLLDQLSGELISATSSTTTGPRS